MNGIIAHLTLVDLENYYHDLMIAIEYTIVYSVLIPDEKAPHLRETHLIFNKSNMHLTEYRLTEIHR